MKRKIIAVNLCMLLLVVIVGVAAASTINNSYYESSPYGKVENGSVTKFEARSRMVRNINYDYYEEKCDSYIKNTTTNMNVNVTVAAKIYSDYAGTFTVVKNNAGTISAGAGLGCASVDRPNVPDNKLYLVHSGTAVGNGSGSPRDSYTVRVYR